MKKIKIKTMIISLSILIMTFMTCTFLKTFTPSEFEDEKKEYDAKLKSLTINNLTLNPEFNPKIFTYNAAIDCFLSSIIITPVAYNNNSQILINNHNVKSGSESDPISLYYGNNYIKIKVISENKEKENTYEIYIGKSNEDTLNWNKKYSNYDGHIDEIAYCIATDKNDNIYVAGTGYNLVSSESKYDWWIKKFSSNGMEDTTNWNKKFHNGDVSYSSDGALESVFSMAIDSNNNVYVAGTVFGLLSSLSGYDWWIKKFNSNGFEDTTYWDKKINNYGYDYVESAYSIAIDSNGNVYVGRYRI